MYLDDEIARLNKLFLGLREKKKVLIWGAAENTSSLFQYTDLLKYSICGVVDNAVEGSFFGMEVRKPCQIEWKSVDAVVISSFYREREIEEELLVRWQFHGSIIRLYTGNEEKPFYSHLSRKELEVPESDREVVEKNSELYNIHSGGRIFILCCGPSINDMDLTVLKNEYTMGVSCFYLHKDISIIQPQYYCCAQYGYGKKITKEVVRKHMEIMERTIGNAQYFFSAHERELIEANQLFEGKKVNYYYYKYWNFPLELYEEVDLCSAIMPVFSVPVLGIQLAMYMGFKEIYLLGVDHDYIITNKYSYFYDRKDSVFGDTDPTADADSNITISFSESLDDMCNLWNNYRILKKIADKKGIKIYNATKGGILDVFERVDFQSLFQ